MSNKKRRNKQAADEVIGSGLTDSTRNQPGEMNIPSSQTIPTASTGGSNLLSYIKTHLWLVGVICFLSLGVLGAGLKYLDESAQREIARRNAAKGNLNNFNDKSQESFLNKSQSVSDRSAARADSAAFQRIYLRRIENVGG